MLRAIHNLYGFDCIDEDGVISVVENGLERGLTDVEHAAVVIERQRLEVHDGVLSGIHKLEDEIDKPRMRREYGLALTRKLAGAAPLPVDVWVLERVAFVSAEIEVLRRSLK